MTTRADILAIVRNVVEASEHLSLDNAADREVLITALCRGFNDFDAVMRRLDPGFTPLGEVTLPAGFKPKRASEDQVSVSTRPTRNLRAHQRQRIEVIVAGELLAVNWRRPGE